MSKQKILAVVVVYKPDILLLRKNIDAIIDQVDKVLLWNNSPESFSERLIIGVSYKVFTITKGENIGISKALNNAWQYAKENRYDYLLTMDQDSVWVNFSGFLEKVFSCSDSNNIFGPEYSLIDSNAIREDEYRITSGMLIPIQLLDIIGGYREDFIVDGIDVELCYRARKYGYKVYYVSGSTLIHQAGNHVECHFMGVKYYSDGYSPFRIYGIIRNHLIIFKEYDVSMHQMSRIIGCYYLKMPIKILFGEDNKREKLAAFYKGLLDGIKYKAI